MIDAEFMEELIRNMPSEEDQLKMDEEKVCQDFEALIMRNAHVNAMWKMYMNYSISEEHAYQKLIVALCEVNDVLTEELTKCITSQVQPSYIK